MRLLLHLALQVGLWSLAPTLDEAGLYESPSLIVMPLSAVLAAFAARDWRWALAAPAAALGLVLVGYSAWTLSSGRETIGGAVRFALGAIPFHLLGTWVLVGVAWWPARRMRSRARPAGA